MRRNRRQYRRKSRRTGATGTAPTARVITQRPVFSHFTAYPGPMIVRPSTKYVFQFRNVVSAVSNGSGVCAGVIPCDPSVTLSATFQSVVLFTEWSAITAFFGRIKCRQLECTLTPETTNETKGDTTANLVIASNLMANTVPSSYQTVADNADSQQWPLFTDLSGRGIYHSMRHQRSLVPASTGTPFPNTNIYAGTPGGIAIYGAGFPISSTLCLIRIVGTYELSQRT